MLGIGVTGDLTDLIHLGRNNITPTRYEITNYFVIIVYSGITYPVCAHRTNEELHKKLSTYYLVSD